MLQRFLHNRTAMFTVAIVLLTALVGIFAPFIAPNDPYETDILNKFAGFSAEYPLGTDNLGRCILSRMIYGIRPTLGLAVLTMLGTIGLGALMGLLAGYFRGIPEEILVENRENCIRIPMWGDIRSLNLSNSVAIVLYEALRQNGFEKMTMEGHLHHLHWKE